MLRKRRRGHGLSIHLCILAGCTDLTANNYNPLANNDNGSCSFALPCEGDLNGDGVRDTADLLIFLVNIGTDCEVIVVG